MPSLVLFASGNGSNVQAIYHYFNDKSIIKLIVCNNPKAGIIPFAESNNIPLLLIDKISFQEENLLQNLLQIKPDLIVLAGFLWKIPESIVNAFPNIIINIHPALLPKYGGKGMYGSKVHEAVIQNQDAASGITIHYVNEHYDEGNIIVQAYCSLSVEDDAASLYGKIQKLEHYYFPRTIAFLLQHQ